MWVIKLRMNSILLKNMPDQKDVKLINSYLWVIQLWIIFIFFILLSSVFQMYAKNVLFLESWKKKKTLKSFRLFQPNPVASELDLLRGLSL